MKLKLLLLFVFVSTFSYAQIPTDEIARYKFTNGSLINDANPGIGDLSPTNFLYTSSSDRGNVASNAITINSDRLKFSNGDLGNTDSNNISISFWINPGNTYSGGTKEILRFSSTAHFSESYIAFQDTRNASNEEAFTFHSETNYFTRNVKRNSVPQLYDGNWHNVIMIAKSSTQYQYNIEFNIYIDGILIPSFQGYLRDTFDMSEIILSVSGVNNSYEKGIDDIRYYQRNLSSAEITALASESPEAVVFIPDTNFKSHLIADTTINTNLDTEIQASEATAFTGDILVSNLNIADLTGILAFKNITKLDVSDNLLTNLNITLQSNLSILDCSNNNLESLDLSNNTNLIEINVASNSLETLNLKNGNTTAITSYNSISNPRLVCVQVDDVSYANINFTNKDAITEFNTVCVKPIFVDVNATGTNDGSSWTNAYTDLGNALSSNSNSKFWIKEGTYIPNGNARNSRFIVTQNQKLYGGFVGTELTESQRDLNANPSILSGDINGNDDGVISFNNASKSDNATNVLTISGNNTLLDGLTISGGNANGSTAEFNQGAAIISNTNVENILLVNCVITDNTSNTGGTIKVVDSGINTDITFKNSVFKNNLARLGSVLYSRPSNGKTITFKSLSSLYFNNQIKDLSGGNGEASVIWLRNDAGGSYDAKIINSTFVNNISEGSNGVSLDEPVISVGSTNNNLVITVFNTIFWNNTNKAGDVTKALGTLNSNPTTSTAVIRNCLDSDNFSNITNKQNIVTTNPNFIDANSNFKLTGISPAVDAGNNQYLSSDMVTDLNNTDRVLNTTVDIGAFEFDATAIVNRNLTLTATNGTISTNPNSTNGVYADGTAVVLTAIPDAGFQFDGWSGDASGNSNPLSVTMDTDKSIIAMFSSIQRTLTTTASNGTITRSVQPTNGVYADGTIVELTATPNANYQFDGWSGDANGNTNPLSVTIDADKNIIATFSLIQQTLTINATNGIVTTDVQPTNGTYDYGTVITLTATANSGFGFTGWGDDVSGTTNPITITMDGNKTATANFSSTANVSDFDKESITIYPNPTQDIINIKSSNLDIDKIEIYNLLGKKILVKSNTSINISTLPTGIYFVKITSTNNTLITKKIIKN